MCRMRRLRTSAGGRSSGSCRRRPAVVAAAAAAAAAGPAAAAAGGGACGGAPRRWRCLRRRPGPGPRTRTPRLLRNPPLLEESADCDCDGSDETDGQMPIFSDDAVAGLSRMRKMIQSDRDRAADQAPRGRRRTAARSRGRRCRTQPARSRALRRRRRRCRRMSSDCQPLAEVSTSRLSAI